MDTQTHAVAAPAAIFVGIDVSKAALDVALRPSGEPWHCTNDETSITTLMNRLQPLAPELVVLEATGGLERLVVAALGLAGLPVAVASPPQVRDFAQATGRLAKTDALDAAVLAHFAAAIHPTPRPLPDAQSPTRRARRAEPDAQSPALAALVERRPQVVGMRTAQKNRMQQALPAGRPKGAAHSAWLEQALKQLDAELDQTLRARPLWRERDHVLRSVPGVPGIGPTVSRTLLAHLPELGQGSACAAKHIATLVGLAPLTRDSGSWRGTRAIWGGRRHVRAALSMAALVGVRHTPVLRTCYQGLLARGKPKKVALTAGLHKLLSILHAVLRDRTPWQPTPLAP
jgi:transposase